MTYIVDGHNLIPKIAGLSLSEMDDETRLIQLLVAFCQKKKVRVIVFFDKAAPGRQGATKHGAVTAYFVPEKQTADDAIHRYLASQRRETGNLTVVSSDRQVQSDARAMRARILSAEAFAKQLMDCIEQKGWGVQGSSNDVLTPDEVAEWEKIFLDYNKLR